MGWAYYLLALVVLLRLAELVHGRRNTLRLAARGGREVGGSHYPLFVALHTAWFIAMFVSSGPDPPLNWPLLALFGLLQVARIWVIASLGPFWTTRIITLDGVPLRRVGPYRYLKHPNYAIVAIEIPLLPLALDLVAVATIFGVLNAALLAFRMRIENNVIAKRNRL